MIPSISAQDSSSSSPDNGSTYRIDGFQNNGDDDSSISNNGGNDTTSGGNSSGFDNNIIEQQQRRRWAVSLYTLTTILLFADQNLLSPNLSAIAEEFQFDDFERDKKLGGDIALAFWILGAPASFLIGCLADQTDRSVLFGITVAIGEGACLATYFSTTYAQLYACRAITGFSVGGALPLIYSVLGDLFVAGERHGVSAVVGIGTGVGIGLGQGVAGFLGPTFGWRMPFLIVSIPALICAALVVMTIEDPPRGGMEEAVVTQQSLLHQQATSEEASFVEGSEGATTATERNYQTSPLSTPSESSCVELTSAQFGLDLANTDGQDPGRHATDCDSFYSKKNNDKMRDRYSTKSNENCAQNEDVYDACGSEEYLLSDHNSDVEDNHNSYDSWTIRFRSFLSLMSTPSVLLAMGQGAPGCVPWGIINTYLNDYLAEDRGMTVEEATFVILAFGVGSMLGMFLGGSGGNFLYAIDRRYPALLAGSTAILGCIPFYFLINTVSSSSPVWLTIFISVSSGIGSGVTGPIIKASLQNVTLPTQRGQAFAVFNIFDDFGRGLGPVFVAVLIANLGGRTPAFNVGVLGWVVCGILNLLVFFFVERDEQNVQLALMVENSVRGV